MISIAMKGKYRWQLWVGSRERGVPCSSTVILSTRQNGTVGCQGSLLEAFPRLRPHQTPIPINMVEGVCYRGSSIVTNFHPLLLTRRQPAYRIISVTGLLSSSARSPRSPLYVQRSVWLLQGSSETVLELQHVVLTPRRKQNKSSN